MDVLDFIFPKINEGRLVHDITLDANQKIYIQILSLLTNKPILYVLNIDENEISAEGAGFSFQKLLDFAEARSNAAIKLCGKLEAEISILLDEEKNLFLEEYNLSEPGLTKLIHTSYKLLELEIFFTVRGR